MKNTLKAALLVSSALVATPVLAQQQPTPPEHYTLDPRGVDLVQGTFNYGVVDVAIGPRGQGGLEHGRVWVNGGWRDTLSGTIAAGVSGTYIVSLGAQAEAAQRGLECHGVGRGEAGGPQPGKGMLYRSIADTVRT